MVLSIKARLLKAEMEDEYGLAPYHKPKNGLGSRGRSNKPIILSGMGAAFYRAFCELDPEYQDILSEMDDWHQDAVWKMCCDWGPRYWGDITMFRWIMKHTILHVQDEM